MKAETPITVQKGGPGPNTPASRMLRYPWDKLEEPRQVNGETVYDSFFVPGKTTKDLGSVVHAAKKRLKLKFASKSVVENDVAGVRVWRVE